MAVHESRHLSLFPPQLLGGGNSSSSSSSRERGLMMMMMMNACPVEAPNVASIYSPQPLSQPHQQQMVYGLPLPTTADALLFHPYNNNNNMNACYAFNDPLQVQPKTTTTTTNPLKSESGITYNTTTNNNNNIILSSSSSSRKRPRDSNCNDNNPMLSFPTIQTGKSSGSRLSFLGEDISHHVQQQYLDIDRLISQHMEKLRAEVEEQRKIRTRRLVEAMIEEGLAKRLRAREEEMEKIGKLNSALEERIRSLCVENQVWRDLAMTNEATANALRTNLEQVLVAQANKADCGGATNDEDEVGGPAMEDAESCCGSSGVGGEGEVGGGREKRGRRRWWWCRECGKEEARVLILPCRHLCLCTGCEPSSATCPVCDSVKNAYYVVNVA